MSHVTDSIHTACTAQCRVDTPLGRVLLARTASGLAGAWFEGQKHHPGVLTAPVRPDDPLLKDAAAQLKRYFSGQQMSFALPLDLLGTAFQKAVWHALQEIPAGSTSTYGAIARRVAAASAVRAVGGAVGRNPVSVIVPCHRVVGSDGSMTGYAGGTDRKLALLKLERSEPRTNA
jgi:methylated-DNA-[protein]-cysteine S-methyltransferase